ncbi:MAG: SRPBCC domain-containing protein [Bacteroidetes bacterium]|nr:SRPBCC domain-containing protein [Bacteroidota bacterium]MBK9672981.1 SRPBCC domain-containing protein [Bacteroidota bacterium]MBK9799166.1 SRPBCC domain-containing protein [Bacteroidota bacterium]
MKTFKKYFTLPASPEEVYLALVKPESIMLWTGDWAEMSELPGSEFSLWDGSIVGKNIEFESNKKIVQHWYFDEASNDSIVTIKLHPQGNETSMEVTHTNIPDTDYDDIAAGWVESYYVNLLDFFEED